MPKGRGKRRLGRLVRATNLVAVVALLLSYVGTYVSPETVSWPALFALGYRFILMVNVVFVIYWLIRRKTWMYLSLSVILLGFPLLTQSYQLFGQNEIPKDANELRVMTYNVRLFNLYEWKEGSTTRDEIFDLISKRDVPVMCFQEFYHSETRKSFPTRDKLLEMYPDIDYHERYTHKMAGNQYFGVVTFSKFPIVARGEVPFVSDDNNFCIYSDIVVNTDTIRVYNAHLSSIRLDPNDLGAIRDFLRNRNPKNFGKALKQSITGIGRIGGKISEANIKRTVQSKNVLSSILESPYPVVLCGDFNDSPVSHAYELFDDHLQDSFTACGSGVGNTYIGDFPSFRIDYVWHSKELSSARYLTLPEEYSDHHPVEVSLFWD